MTRYQFECWNRKNERHRRKRQQSDEQFRKFIEPVFRNEYGKRAVESLNRRAEAMEKLVSMRKG